MAAPARRASARALPARRTGVRELAAQATRESILRAATKVFAKHGYDGGSVEKISKAAKSYDRMIYYYFGSKEGLFIAVLEEIYRRFNEAEAALELDAAQPVEALADGDPLRAAATTARTPSSSRCSTPRTCTAAGTSRKSLRAREYSSPAIDVIRQRAAQRRRSRGCFAPTWRRATSTC